MDVQFEHWLRKLHPEGTTAGLYLSSVKRIEDYYGDLDQAWAEDELEEIYASLTYSAVDDRNNEPNPSKLPIEKGLYKSLASYRSCVNKYARFCEERGQLSNQLAVSEETAEAQALGFRYEQDLQTALVACIDQIEPGLRIAENGVERQVPSGRIDALAIDSAGHHVVIELKAVTAKREVLGQIAAYMADIEDETGDRPRGILIAPDFDAKLLSGARMISGLSLMTYAFKFTFEAAGLSK